MKLRDPSGLLGNAPEGAHLGLLTGEGTAIAIPKGATLLEIIDPKDSRAITPLVLVSVTPGKWVFRCRCNPQCHAVYTHKITSEGAHTGNAQRKHRRR